MAFAGGNYTYGDGIVDNIAQLEFALPHDSGEPDDAPPIAPSLDGPDLLTLLSAAQRERLSAEARRPDVAPAAAAAGAGDTPAEKLYAGFFAEGGASR